VLRAAPAEKPAAPGTISSSPTVTGSSPPFAASWSARCSSGPLGVRSPAPLEPPVPPPRAPPPVPPPTLREPLPPSARASTSRQSEYWSMSAGRLLRASRICDGV
jgi:hypothetical protein